ncbi:hypothetical protein ACFL2R_02715 [Patescibacteria group bacterium]
MGKLFGIAVILWIIWCLFGEKIKAFFSGPKGNKVENVVAYSTLGKFRSVKFGKDGNNSIHLNSVPSNIYKVPVCVVLCEPEDVFKSGHDEGPSVSLYAFDEQGEKTLLVQYDLSADLPRNTSIKIAEFRRDEKYDWKFFLCDEPEVMTDAPVKPVPPAASMLGCEHPGIDLDDSVFEIDDSEEVTDLDEVGIRIVDLSEADPNCLFYRRDEEHGGSSDIDQEEAPESVQQQESEPESSDDN